MAKLSQGDEFNKNVNKENIDSTQSSNNDSYNPFEKANEFAINDDSFAGVNAQVSGSVGGSSGVESVVKIRPTKSPHFGADKFGKQLVSMSSMQMYSMMTDSPIGQVASIAGDAKIVASVIPTALSNNIASIAMTEMSASEYKEAVSKFKSMGYGTISGNPMRQVAQINEILRKNKGNLSDAQVLLLNRMKAYQEGAGLRKPSQRMRIVGIGKKYIMRQMRRTDGGQMIAVMMLVQSNLKRILARASRIAANARHAMRFASQKAMIASLNAAINTAKMRLEQAKTEKEVREAKKALEKATGTDASYRNAKRRAAEKAVRRKRRLGDPFGFRKWTGNLVRNFTNETLLGKIIKLIAQKIAAIFHVIAAMFSLVYVAAFALFIIILIVFMSQIISFSTSTIDLTNQDEEIINEAIKTLQQCYQDQSNTLTNMDDGSYTDGVTVKYETERNTDVYADFFAGLDIDDDSYTYDNLETAMNSNCNIPEILSMAMIYFDYDLEDAGKEQVLDYVKKLYNGSNLISIDDKEWTEEVNGSEVYHNSATVTVTSYYFDDIFDCSLMESVGELSGNTTTEQVWSYFTSAGFSEESTAAIMGNMYQESGIDPKSIQGGGKGPAAGILQWENYNTKSGRWKDLSSFASSKGTDWTDLQTQLEFIVSKDMAKQFSAYTGHGTHTYSTGAVAWWPTKVTVDQYKQMTDIEKATEIWERVFTRASKPNMSRRITAAKRYYEQYHGKTFSSTSTSTSVNGTGVQAILSAADYVTNIAESQKWTYLSTGKGEHSLAESMKSKHTSCANFVCAILQEAGYLKKGQLFWSSANGKTHWSKSVENQIKKNFDIIYVNYDKNFQLQAGDVILFSNGLQHTALYAGKVNGKKMWYDGGKGSTKNHAVGSVFNNMYRTSTVNKNKYIRCVFRLKSQ